jgi:hypothetical protein
MKVADYLRIEDEYRPGPMAVRWVNSGEAIEFANGKTFALRQEVALFLEGFGLVRPLLHFPMMLHLLALVGQESARTCREVEILQSMFRLHHRPLRNAGELCAHLCGNAVPNPADPVDLEEVRLHLQSGPLMTVLMCHWRNERTPATRELPPLKPGEIEQHIFRALQGFTLQQLKHWLQHGRGPIEDAADEVAREMSVVPPRTLGEVFSRVAQRGRVAAVLPFVDQMVSALSLPPRRLVHQELPVGGYADISTRGQPEHILVSQFALDELEFVRRFAERELLYFRREEPHKQTREELLVVLDQGVRTWGDVRLLLTAAILAFARLAQTRKMPFRLTGTSVSTVLDPLAVEEQALGDLLEASDLSLNPGLALERALEEPTAEPREVLLLTHPRNLTEEDVQAAAKRLQPGTRLFAVSADERGGVQLSELRYGTSLTVSRFNVDLSPPREETAGARRLQPTAHPPWTGDVEPIGFPFGDYQIPPDWANFERKFDFDRSGEWLLVSGPEGMLQVHRIGADGRRSVEVLPRGIVEGEIIQEVTSIRGVTGGFVVGGLQEKSRVVIHYNFADRSVQTYRLSDLPFVDFELIYSAKFHAVVLRHFQRVFGTIDLARKKVEYADLKYGTDTPAASLARSVLQDFRSVPDLNFALVPRNTPAKDQALVKDPCLVLSEENDTLRVEGAGLAWKPIRPEVEGKPMFQKGAPLRGKLQGEILAVASFDRLTHPIVVAFHGPDGKCIGVFPAISPHAPFALSADGRYLALQGKMKGVVVRDLRQDGRIVCTTRREHRLAEVQVELGERSMIVVTERYSHLFRWQGGVLETRTRPTVRSTSELRAEAGESPKRWATLPTTPWRKLLEIARKLRPGVGGDNPSLRLRFLRRARSTVLVGVDPFGYLAVFDPQGVLVSLFYFRGKIWWVWLPDGTVYRSDGSDKPAPAEALNRLAQALHRASEVGVVVRS